MLENQYQEEIIPSSTGMVQSRIINKENFGEVFTKRIMGEKN